MKKIRIPGINSLLGRYIYVSIFLGILFLCVAIIGQIYVEKQGQIHEQKMAIHAITDSDIQELSIRLHELESAIWQFVLLPEKVQRKTLNNKFELYDKEISRILSAQWPDNTPDIKHLLEEAKHNSNHISSILKQLIPLQVDTKEISGVSGRQYGQAKTKLFQTQIIPMITDSNKLLQKIVVILDESNMHSMMDMKHVSSKISTGLWLISLTGLLIIVAGYLTVNRGIIKPVALFARAFREEARGEKPVFTLDTSLEETSSLADAFKDMREQVHIRQQSLENILDNAAEAIITIDVSGTIKTFNRAAEQLFGYQDEEVLGKSVFMLTSNPEQFQHDDYISELMRTGESGIIGNVWEMNIQRKNGEFVRVALKISSALVGGKRLYTGLVEDISERSKMVTKLQNMAEQDSLTGLPNRAMFKARLEHAVEQAQHSETLVALMFLDLDKFKDINDSLGHHSGDEVLQKVAQRLRAGIREGDTVARLGGDEFTIILEGLHHKDEAINVAKKILEIFSAPIILHKQEYYIGTSIGITLFPNDSEEMDILIRNADIAMYDAKQQGGSSYKFYSKEMSTEVKKRLGMQTALHHAVKNQEFVLHYQPILDLKSGRLIGVEALLRWNHPETGLMLPGDFMETLEETGLIIQVTEWILEQVGNCFQELESAGLPDTTISVNFTPQCFSIVNMVNCIEKFLESHRLPPKNLIIEVTENILITSGDYAASAIQQLKEFGMKIALDDFGTGYSSLSHLRSFPIDIIKIDREFVQDIALNEDDATLASAIISMAHHLGLKVIAEGIETTEQLEFMRSQQCDAIQGYLISRPVELEKVISIFKKNALDNSDQVVHFNKKRPT